MNRWITGLVLIVFSCCSAADPEESSDREVVRPGIEAIDSGDYQKAHEIFLEGAKSSCHLCQHNLGMTYYAGIGTERDLVKALVWLRVSALNGDLRSLAVAEKIGLALDREEREEVIARSRELDLEDMRVTPDIPDSRAGSKELRMRFANVRELSKNPYRQRMLENPDHYLRFATEEERTTWGNGAANAAMEYKAENARRKARVERIREMLPRPTIRYRDFRLIEFDPEKARPTPPPSEQDRERLDRPERRDTGG